MAIGHVVTHGFGNGTFSGAIKEVVANGFIIDALGPDFPLLTSATVALDGNSVSVLIDQAVKDGGAGLNGFIMTASGGAVTLTYASGAPGTPLIYTASRTINFDEILSNFSYTQPGNGVEAVDDDADMASFSGESVGNGSQVNRPPLFTNSLMIGIGIRI